MRIWDVHCHLTGLTGSPRQRVARLLRAADRLNIERICVHMGMEFNHDPDPEEVQRQNGEVLAGISGREDRAFGFVYLNPKYPEASHCPGQLFNRDWAA